jgi:DNA transposition AAA+ family ATPase
MTPRDEARQALRIYQSRTGLSLREIADRTGFSHHSLRQFVSIARYGDGEGEFTAQAILGFIAENPAAKPELPGKLYETNCSRTIDTMLKYVARGRWGTMYGPAGAQKSFVLEYRAAEAAADPEPNIVYVCCSPTLTPCALTHRIATALGTPYAQSREGAFQAVLFALRRRAPVALVIDEAQHLYKLIDTLETIRDIADASHGKMGILIAGNDQVTEIFKNRRGINFEQWRSRVEQKSIVLLGLAPEEAQEIAHTELPQLKPEAIKELVQRSTVQHINPEAGKLQNYVNARRLFNAIRDFREATESRRPRLAIQQKGAA